MKVVYTSPSGRLQFEVEVATGKQAFEVVSAIQELFEEEACGCCHSKRIRFEVREFGGNKYYKMACQDCSAQLDFGQNKDGKGLFVKRRTKDSQPLPNDGWYVYSRGDQQQQTDDGNRPY